MDLTTHIENVLTGLNACQIKYYEVNGLTNCLNFPDIWKIGKVGKKFLHLNCGSSGAFLIEKETGELFNIKGYGVPDYNKKKKADIGNIQTVNPEILFTKRYNYLR